MPLGKHMKGDAAELMDLTAPNAIPVKPTNCSELVF